MITEAQSVETIMEINVAYSTLIAITFTGNIIFKSKTCSTMSKILMKDICYISVQTGKSNSEISVHSGCCGSNYNLSAYL